MAQHSIILLGSFQVQRDGVAVTRFHGDKVRALLAYLAVESDRPHARAALAGLFWPEQPDDQALRNLTQALVRLREALGAGDDMLHATRQAVQWRPAAAEVDVAEFARLARSTETADLAQAAALYRGEFLAGFALPGCEAFEEWLLLAREQFQQQALAVLHTLAEQHLAAGRIAHAAEAARRQLTLDPWREDAHRQLRRALAAAGGRAAALAAYVRCRQVLADELDAEPDAATTALYEQIAASQFALGSMASVETITPPVPPNNLPAPLTSFIGREVELAQLAQRLRHTGCRLLTLVGPGGVGKTRLARELAARALPDFAEGVFFVALAPLDRAEMVPSAIAQAIGLQEDGRQPLPELLRMWLHARCLLLVLDNFEHLLAAASQVTALLAGAPRLKVLATSREPLGLHGEHVFGVPTLALPDSDHLPEPQLLAQNEAVSLFVARAQAAQFDFALSPANASTIVTICRQLDGLPLAIELAAARVRLFPPAALLARLARRLDLLAASGRDQPARQQTMRNTIAWSYDLLDQAERALCRRVAVFAGGFTLAAAEAVAAELRMKNEEWRKESSELTALHSSFSFLHSIEALVDKSLLLHVEHAGEPRFMMLETIREYGLEQLAASEETDAVRLAHAHYYLALAEQAAPRLISGDRDTWLDRLALEHDNMRAVLAWSLEELKIENAELRKPAGQAEEPFSILNAQFSISAQEIGLRLAGALAWFWILRCHFSEGRRWFESALQRAAAGPGPGDVSIHRRPARHRPGADGSRLCGIQPGRLCCGRRAARRERAAAQVGGRHAGARPCLQQPGASGLASGRLCARTGAAPGKPETTASARRHLGHRRRARQPGAGGLDPGRLRRRTRLPPGEPGPAA
jgi:predicted ATPase/DNA-binding SARP family transcriptional activator